MNCDNCDSIAFLQCSACNEAYYCDKNCQKQHFEQHDCIGRKAAGGGKSGRAYAKQNKVMKEFHQGKLHSGPGGKHVVTNEKQAWAIAYATSKKNKK